MSLGEGRSEHREDDDFINRHPWVTAAAGALAVGLVAWKFRKEISTAARSTWTNARQMAAVAMGGAWDAAKNLAKDDGVAGDLRQMGHDLLQRTFRTPDGAAPAAAPPADRITPTTPGVPAQ